MRPRPRATARRPTCHHRLGFPCLLRQWLHVRPRFRLTARRPTCTIGSVYLVSSGRGIVCDHGLGQQLSGLLATIDSVLLVSSGRGIVRGRGLGKQLGDLPAAGAFCFQRQLAAASLGNSSAAYLPSSTRVALLLGKVNRLRLQHLSINIAARRPAAQRFVVKRPAAQRSLVQRPAALRPTDRLAAQTPCGSTPFRSASYG